MTLATTSHDVALGDVTIHYLRSTAARRETVLLIHGWPQTSHCWAKVAPLLVDHDLLMPDLRGLGESSAPAAGYDKKTLAADMVALVDHLGIDRLFVVGHDWGGVTAFFTAAALGRRCLGLAVLDVTIPGSPSVNFSQDGKRWHHRFHQAVGLPEILIEGNEAAYYGWFYETFGHKPGVIDPDDVALYVRAYSRPGRLPGHLAYYRTMDQDIVDARQFETDRLPMPVLALGGGDSYGRGDEPVRSLKSYADDVQGGTIAACGHWMPEEQPEVLADRLLAFFSHCRERHAMEP